MERAAEEKNDFLDGRIFRGCGHTARHSLICVNLIGAVGNRLRAGPSILYGSTLRVKIETNGLRCYPDATVINGGLAFDQEDDWSETVTNPTVIFEVMDDLTEAYDRGVKAQSYRSAQSIQAFVFITQREPRIEVYTRTSNGRWELEDFAGVDRDVSIPPLSLNIPFAEFYGKITFGRK